MKNIVWFVLVAVLAISSCVGEGNKPVDEVNALAVAENDSMIYGLACDGSNDSVIVFLPFKECADPVIYNIEVAKAEGRVIGKPAIGDWVGVLLNPEDTTEATMVVNLDQLKGTWTYPVRPTWKDASKLSRRALARKLNEMPDSLKEAYLVPREYGFSLQRSSVARPVGRVRTQSSLEDDSPVEYPSVKQYTGWKCRNGKLYLMSSDGPLPIASASGEKDGKKADAKPQNVHVDTFRFVYLDDDSLVLLTMAGQQISFSRKANAQAANAEAQKAASKVAKKVLK